MRRPRRPSRPRRSVRRRSRGDTPWRRRSLGTSTRRPSVVTATRMARRSRFREKPKRPDSCYPPCGRSAQSSGWGVRGATTPTATFVRGGRSGHGRRWCAAKPSCRTSGGPHRGARPHQGPESSALGKADPPRARNEQIVVPRSPRRCRCDPEADIAAGRVGSPVARRAARARRASPPDGRRRGRDARRACSGVRARTVLGREDPGRPGEPIARDLRSSRRRPRGGLLGTLLPHDRSRDPRPASGTHAPRRCSAPSIPGGTPSPRLPFGGRAGAGSTSRCTTKPRASWWRASSSPSCDAWGLRGPASRRLSGPSGRRVGSRCRGRAVAWRGDDLGHHRARESAVRGRALIAGPLVPCGPFPPRSRTDPHR